jgi:hypothetical protein
MQTLAVRGIYRVVAPRIAPSPHPGADLVEVVEGALAREDHLFAAGEGIVLRRLLALDPEARELWARLSLRTGGAAVPANGAAPAHGAAPANGVEPGEPVRGEPADATAVVAGPAHAAGPVFRVRTLRYALDLDAAVARLAEAGLAHTTLPDDLCAPAFDVPALKDACRRLGLPVGGARPALVERLRGRRWVDEPVLLLGHVGLVRRAELLYFQRASLDRTTMVVERIGQLRWPAYTPTGGPGLFPDRAALLRYERARAGAWTDPEEPLRIALAGRPAAPLSPWRRAVEAVLATDPAADVLGRLVAAGAGVRPVWALRLERERRVAEALAVCRAIGAEDAGIDAATAIALERTGRRLARGLGQGWVPRPPLLAARVRRLRVPPGPRDGRRGARPTWRIGGEVLFVEEACVRVVAAAGRRALHAENWLWTSLYALVFRDLYFLPVPGMLPTARRDGPLDVGTPGFHARRRDAVDARLTELAAVGPAPFAASWSGERLAGLQGGEEVLAGCAAIPGRTAAVVLGRLAREGWSAARGLPDLYIFPGPGTRLGDAVPARLDDADLLAEIKGPGDSLRDEQRVWHHHLVQNAIPVELWEVAEGSPETG